MTFSLYPFAIEPSEREAIWGGHALVERFGKRGSHEAKLGESWECWDGNTVGNGAHAGKTLAQLRAELGSAFTGRADPASVFPILTKLIDARDALSVQVHPSDAYAQRVEHQPVGKSECWYVLEAEPEATIVLGWNRDTSRGEYLERVRDGSLGELLRHVPARAGDVFYLPAGTLHAIGAGIVLFETQQTSDLTYRIFDYNRTGPDGKPRELHVEKAADVLDYRRGQAGALTHLTYELHGLERTTLVAGPRFILERIEPRDEPSGVDLDDMPLAVLALGGAVELEARGTSLRLEAYETAVVPAALEVVMVRALEPGAALLTAAPPEDADAIERRFSRAAVPVGASTDFLAQFLP
jgi:mannose-6-phosphate isomerase